MTIHELAERCQQMLVRTQQLFELTGQWSAIAEHDVQRVTLARISTHAAAQVEWWSQRRPDVELATPDTPAVDTTGPHGAIALAALTAEGPTTQGLRGLAELLGYWIDELTDWATHHDPLVDAPTVRVLDLVLADLQRDRDDLARVA